MKSHSMRTFVLMCLSVIGALVGALVFFWGTGDESKAFITSSEFVTWFFFNELAFAAYPVIAVLMWKPLTQLGKHLHRNWFAVLGQSVILGALFIFPALVSRRIIFLAKPLPLEHAKTKMLVLQIVGFLVSLLPLSIGIWLTHEAIDDAFGGTLRSESSVKDYIRLRDYLQHSLMILGALLSLFVLASTALRTAMIAWGVTTAKCYPTIYIVIFGAYETLLLAIVYFPAYASLVSAGQRLLDCYFPLPAPDDESWSTAYSGRKELEALLELKVPAEQRFSRAITLLAPFVGSIFSLLEK